MLFLKRNNTKRHLSYPFGSREQLKDLRVLEKLNCDEKLLHFMGKPSYTKDSRAR